MIFRAIADLIRERKNNARIGRIHRALQGHGQVREALNQVQGIEGLLENEIFAPPLVSEGESRETPLHDAVKNSNYDLVKELIDQGSDPNAIDSQGQTPLHKAVLQADLKMVKILKSTPGVKLNIKDNKGRTPKDLVPFALKRFDAETATRISESLMQNIFQNGNSPISSRGSERAIIITNSDEIMDELNQPSIDHQNSKEGLSKYIDKESLQSKKSERNSTLEALTRVLEHHFDVKQTTRNNPKQQRQNSKKRILKT